ncbi:MAG: hypothetical protein WA749_09020 [Gelidibacter sp.]
MKGKNHRNTTILTMKCKFLISAKFSDIAIGEVRILPNSNP